MRATPTIPLAGVSDLCRPAGDELEARSKAAVLDKGGWAIRWHQPPKARDDDPGLFVVASVSDPIGGAWVGNVTYRVEET